MVERLKPSRNLFSGYDVIVAEGSVLQESYLNWHPVEASVCASKSRGRSFLLYSSKMFCPTFVSDTNFPSPLITQSRGLEREFFGSLQYL